MKKVILLLTVMADCHSGVRVDRRRTAGLDGFRSHSDTRTDREKIRGSILDQGPPGIAAKYHRQLSRPRLKSGKGPDIVIWAHDKVGEWADAGLISPVEVKSVKTREKYFPQAWEAVTHKERIWGFPIGMETVTLIYNKKLLDGAPPKSLSDLTALNEKIKQEHPGVSQHSLGLQERLLFLGHLGERRRLHLRPRKMADTISAM